MNRRIRLAALAVLGAFVVGMGLAEAQTVVSKPPKWDREEVRLASTIPVQEDGRVKPLSTYADFALLRISGHRTAKNLDDKSITPVEWLLDSLFYPEAAERYKIFLVESREVVNAIGVSTEGKGPRDRYSFVELSPGIPKLSQLAQKYAAKEPKDRSIVENQIVNLANNVMEFANLTHFLDFARENYLEGQAARLTQLLPETAKDAPFSAILSKTNELRALYTMLSNPVQGVDEQTRTQEQHQVEHVLQTAAQEGEMAQALALFPPEDPKQNQWQSPSDVTQAAFMQGQVSDKSLAMLASIEKLARLRDNPAQFKAQLASFHDLTVGAAVARGEYNKVPLEYFFYKGSHRAFLYTSFLYVVGAGLLVWLFFRPRAKWAAVLATLCFAIPTVFTGYLFYQALMMYVLAFIIVAVLWMRPKSTFLAAVAPVAIAAPTLVLIAGITLRCIIRNRPPVSTLYETVLFITACVVVVSLAIELVDRRRIALSMGAFLGVAGLFLANKYEMSEGVDTMPSLVAVLDTNFWLSTHVTTVTMGYAAGLLAAAIAHVYIIGRLLGLKKNDPDFYSGVSRMTYGVLCFGLVFSVLGTVLGGIWANESWGRFWGWDPKENGALMIVLWELAMLHALAGRYIRDLGLAVASVFGAIVVGFSWWGVNLLGVGLHSYGFTSGAARTLRIFYAVELLVILMGAVVWMRERAGEREPAPEPAPTPTPRKVKGSARAAKG